MEEETSCLTRQNPAQVSQVMRILVLALLLKDSPTWIIILPFLDLNFTIYETIA